MVIDWWSIHSVRTSHPHVVRWALKELPVMTHKEKSVRLFKHDPNLNDHRNRWPTNFFAKSPLTRDEAREFNLPSWMRMTWLYYSRKIIFNPQRERYKLTSHNGKSHGSYLTNYSTHQTPSNFHFLDLSHHVLDHSFRDWQQNVRGLRSFTLLITSYTNL